MGAARRSPRRRAPSARLVLPLGFSSVAQATAGQVHGGSFDRRDDSRPERRFPSVFRLTGGSRAEGSEQVLRAGGSRGLLSGALGLATHRAHQNPRPVVGSKLPSSLLTSYPALKPNEAPEWPAAGKPRPRAGEKQEGLDARAPSPGSPPLPGKERRCLGSFPVRRPPGGDSRPASAVSAGPHSDS